jgi:hypothetical protein
VVSSLLGGGSSFPGLYQARTSFRPGAGTMNQMFQFMPPQARQSAMAMMSILQSSQSLLKIAETGRVNVQGGNPIQKNVPRVYNGN